VSLRKKRQGGSSTPSREDQSGDRYGQGQGRAPLPPSSKRQFPVHVKTRYRGLPKNRAQLFTLFALGNLFPGPKKADGIEDVSAKDRQTAYERADLETERSTSNSPFCPAKRSKRHLGAAETVNQTFP